MGLEPTHGVRALAVLVLFSLGGARGADPAFTPFDTARPILDLFADRLPAGLVNPTSSKWDDWNRENDLAIRRRLETGDLDSMVNLLLFGTSFTTQPRIAFDQLAEQARGGVLNARVADLVQGLSEPGRNERLKILHDLLRGKGIDLDSDQGRSQAGVFILQNLTRVLEEKREFAARSSAAVEKTQASAAESILVERSNLFRDRGVSLDTGILADFSIDLALRRAKEQGLLRSDQISRVAVIGPGLAFIDKDPSAAYDYFPPQTVQPFAVIDSLLSLGLSRQGSYSLTAFDISPLVLGHLQRARQQATKGNGYVLQLPQDTQRSWPPDLVDYWGRLGNRVGAAVKPLAPPPAFAHLATRAIRVRPDVVLSCQADGLDIVAQSLELPADQRFDLVIATNIFLYYDQFQQALAMRNVAHMMKPGALLLSNDELPALPSSRIRRIGVSAVSDGASGRDAVAYYQKQ